jgi:CCR4-NOT transcription complex subunit 1
VALIQASILNVLELDSHLAKEMESIRLPLIEFVANLIQRCICGPKSFLTPNEFYFSLVTLAKLKAADHLPPRMDEVLEEIQNVSPGIFLSQDTEYLSLKEALVMLFDEWVRLLQSMSPENAWKTFLPMLVEKKVIEDPDLFALLIRHSAEVSIDTYYKLRNAPGGAILGYQVIDALSAMIVLLVKNTEKDEEGRVYLFSRVLSVLSLVTIHMHEVRRELFDQRPFYRIFAGILADLEPEMSGSFAKIQFQLISAFRFVLELQGVLYILSNMLHMMRPTVVPGFIYAWVELISHRLLMPKILAVPEKAVHTSISTECNLLFLGLADIPRIHVGHFQLLGTVP